MSSEFWSKQINNPFWDFSLDVYRNNTVKQICLSLQNRFDYNVNILLYIYWLAQSDCEPLSTTNIQMILNQLNEWHIGITQGLQQIRFRLEKYPNSIWYKNLRQFVLDTELIAEHAEQTMLYELRHNFEKKNSTNNTKIKNALQSLANYSRIIQSALQEEDIRHISTLTHIIFPDFDIQTIDQWSKMLNFVLI